MKLLTAREAAIKAAKDLILKMHPNLVKEINLVINAGGTSCMYRNDNRGLDYDEENALKLLEYEVIPWGECNYEIKWYFSSI